VVKIDLSVARPGEGPILEVQCQPREGDVEALSVR
jgi:hypothetical protein